MKPWKLSRKTLALAGMLIALAALFVYVALRSGPLAPIAVTVAKVESRALEPALSGIGTVEARASYRIGPTVAGRVKRVEADVGDRVRAGQVLGEMDPVDLDDRLRAQESIIKRSEAALREAEARAAYAEAQTRRYEKLAADRMVSEEMLNAKRQERDIAQAALAAAREEISRAKSDREGSLAQRGHLKLVAPIDGIVVERAADPGSTVLGGQAVLEVIDPKALWVNVRFDQLHAAGLAPGLPAEVTLRSQSAPLNGRVLRVEPKADAITEETLAKVAIELQAGHPPPVGELAEVTVKLPATPALPYVSNAALRREGERTGVWRLASGKLEFAPLRLGASDLDGRVQVREGLKAGDEIIVYSEKALSAASRVHVVEHIAGAAR